MPFTKAYSDHLNDLSTSIEGALNQLYQESLEVFVGDSQVIKNTKLAHLLKTPCANFTPEQVSELHGENKKEFGARQRWLLLSQAWNEINLINMLIKNGDLNKPESIAKKIETAIKTLAEVGTEKAKDIFPEHTLSDRKVDFVKAFIDVAHQLLKKQFAVQNILATNTEADLPTHATNQALRNARQQFNEDLKQYEESALPSIQAFEHSLATIETNIKQLESVKNQLEAKETSLKTPDPDISKQKTLVETVTRELESLLSTENDDTLGILALEELSKDIANKATTLHDAVKAYEASALNKTKNDIEQTEQFVEEQSEALLALSNAIATATPNEPYNPTNENTALKSLNTSFNRLNQSLTDELAQLELHLNKLNELKRKEKSSENNAANARNESHPLLQGNPDELSALENLDSVCCNQHSTVENLTAKARLTTWQSFHKKVKDQFTTLINQHNTFQQLQSNSSKNIYIDASFSKALDKAINETDGKIKALHSEIKRENIEEKKRNTPHHFTQSLSTLKENQQRITDACTRSIEKLDSNLIKEASINLHSEVINLAKDQIRRSNEKRRTLVFQMDHLKHYEDEKTHLTQRLTSLRDTYQAVITRNRFIDISEDLQPDALLNKLNNISVNLQTFPMENQQSFLSKLSSDSNPLEALRSKIDELDTKITHANRSHPHRRKGIFVGGLAGGAVAAVICGGIVASVIFSFGLSLPVLIAVGAAAAIAPAFFAGIGRFFGGRKDKAAFRQAELDRNNKSIESGPPQNTVIVSRKKRSSKHVDLEDPNFEQQLADAAVNRPRQPLNRVHTMNFQSLYGTKALNRFSIRYQSTHELGDGSTSDDDEIVPSFPQDQDGDIATQNIEASVNSSASTSFEQPIAAPSRASTPEPTYSLVNGGIFNPKQGPRFTLSFTQRPAPQQVQGETSEPVVVNAHRPG